MIQLYRRMIWQPRKANVPWLREGRAFMHGVGNVNRYHGNNTMINEEKRFGKE
jgi:hypothetical protein